MNSSPSPDSQWAPGCIVKRSVLSPELALAVAALLTMILVKLLPPAGPALQFDHHAVRAGQWWRLLTCNLTHWSWAHLAGDAAVLAALCWLGQDRGRWMLVTALTSAAAVGLGVYVVAGDVNAYRGLSGVNYALISYVLVTLAATARPLPKIAYLGVVAAMAAKAAYEMVTGDSPFATGLPPAIEVVGISHAAGVVVGTLAALAARVRQPRAAGAREGIVPTPE